MAAAVGTGGGTYLSICLPMLKRVMPLLSEAASTLFDPTIAGRVVMSVDDRCRLCRSAASRHRLGQLGQGVLCESKAGDEEATAFACRGLCCGVANEELIDYCGHR